MAEKGSAMKSASDGDGLRAPMSLFCHVIFDCFKLGLRTAVYIHDIQKYR